MEKIVPSDINIVNISAEKLMINIFNTIYLVAGALAVAMIIYAGIQYVTSAGNSTKVESAKNTITYSVIGLIVILLATVITNFVVKEGLGIG